MTTTPPSPKRGLSTWALFALIAALLAIIPSIMWGFSGGWALTALIPAAIAALTVNHIRIPREPNRPGVTVRPTVIVLGALFALATGFASVLFMWAATASPAVQVTAEATIEAPAPRVWTEVTDIPHRSTWCTWITDADPIGRGGPPALGSAYRATLALERFTVPGDLTITTFTPNQHFAWDINPTGGSELHNLRESITLTPESDTLTRVRYTLSYDVPTTVGRVAERLAVRGAVTRLADSAVTLLRQRLIAPQ